MMNGSIRKLILKYNLITSLYTSGIGIWSGTIYLYMEQIHYSYGQINLFLSIFWIVTFLAELPSGILADSIGRMNTLILSCLVRSTGLLFLFFDWGNLTFLILSAILTALGDSLYSGTASSWVVDTIQDIEPNFDLGRVFSRNTAICSFVSLITGFFGAQVLANINLSYPILIGALLLLAVIPFAVRESKGEKRGIHLSDNIRFSDNLKERFHPFNDMLTGIKQLGKNKNLLAYMLAFLPITLIVTGPFNQWQLYFQNGVKTITVGNVLLGVNILGIVGAYLAKYLLQWKIKKVYMLMGLTTLNSICIILCVVFGNKLMAILVFWMHILLSSSDEVSRYTVLHQKIRSDDRTTLVSLYNTLEAAVTVVALGINGILSDKYSIGFAWVALTVVGFLLAMVGYTIIASTSERTRKSEVQKEVN